MSDNTTVALTLIMFLAAVVTLRATMAWDGRQIRRCRTCGHCGRPVVSDGYLAIEIVLWALCCVGGALYSGWRIVGRRLECEKCGSTAMARVPPPVRR